MTSFPLKIVTPDGLIFDGTAEMVTVRTVEGDMAVMARHINCVVPLGMGTAAVVTGGERKIAACIGGLLSVNNGECTLVPTTFEWAENIDVSRAEKAQAKAQAILDSKKDDEVAQKLAEAKLRRALIRKNVAEQYKG
ncbi:MAG: ATP synthase F1 subunit epsilon [Clostridia bacterium]|nr:ATP synthase F1 subunit epsilon [Clostridia bacterium]